MWMHLRSKKALHPNPPLPFSPCKPFWVGRASSPCPGVVSTYLVATRHIPTYLTLACLGYP